MKNIYALVLLISIFILNSCTQNNGYIGPIFGSWSLVSISEDGVPIQLEDETVLSFQNEVVQVSRLVNPPYTIEVRYGNFSIDDDVLTLKFQALPTSDGSYMYTTPDWLHFPMDGNPIHFDVKKLNGSKMILILTSEKNKLEYSFDRTW